MCSKNENITILMESEKHKVENTYMTNIMI